MADLVPHSAVPVHRDDTVSPDTAERIRSIGSLCSGYRGLDAAVETVLGAATAWCADNDSGVAKLLAHHWPDTPNHGDITAIDWANVEPVSIVTAGFPCTDISSAGKRAGLKPGTQSGVWHHVARAIHELQPELVVIENVRNILNVEAHSDVEPCPWCLGNSDDEPALRALGCVLGDLADLGFDAEWIGVPAAAMGCCHLRWRVFIAAANTSNGGREGGWRARGGVGWAYARRFNCYRAWWRVCPVRRPRSCFQLLGRRTGQTVARTSGARQGI